MWKKKVITHAGVSYAMGTVIDGHLSKDANDALYALWEGQDGWPEILSFRGGIKGITCEMVKEVGEQALYKAFRAKYKVRKGKELSGEVWRVALENAGR